MGERPSDIVHDNSPQVVLRRRSHMYTIRSATCDVLHQTAATISDYERCAESRVKCIAIMNQTCQVFVLLRTLVADMRIFVRRQCSVVLFCFVSFFLFIFSLALSLKQ